jgi:tetratricopeptide (TPR) repeat protein
MNRFSLALGVAWALSAAAAPRAPVVALVPLGDTSEELRPLGLLAAARASESLAGASEVHLQQTLRALSDEGLALEAGTTPTAIATAAKQLGAERVVTFRIVDSPASPSLAMELVITMGAQRRTRRVSLGTTWTQAVDRGSRALVEAALGFSPKAPSAQPTSDSEEALEAAGRCYSVVLRQPLAISLPAPVDSAELEGAMEACQEALAIDPSFDFAAATLALAQVLVGADERASRTLASLTDGGQRLLPAVLARFWLLTRYQSNEAGAAFLDEYLGRRPGALLARATLGESQAMAGADARAETVFRASLKLAPSSSWAWAQLSRVLAHRGRAREAVSAARRGLELAPASRAARLELGQRLLDAGQPAAAREQLRPLADRRPLRGEDVLQLGIAAWRLGQTEAAATYFERALDAAGTDAEWRTRARAFYQLALLEAKRGRPGAARVALRASLRAGLRVREMDPLLADAAREIDRSDSGGLLDGGRDSAPSGSPREASLYPLDPFGEPDPAAPKPPPPEGMAFYR